MGRIKSIQGKILLLLLGVAIPPLVITGFFGLQSSRKQLTHQIEDHLQTVVDVKRASIDAYYKELAANGKALAHHSATRGFLHEYYTNPEGFKEAPVTHRASELMHKFQESHWGSLHHIFIADKEGKVILSPPHGNSTKSHLNHSIVENPFFKEALHKAQLTDFFGFEEKDHFHQLYMQPVKDEAGNPLGVIVFEITIADIRHRLKEGIKLGESGKIFLTTLDGREIVHSKSEFLDEPIHAEGVHLALQKGRAAGVFKSNGESIFGVYVKDPQYPFVIASEINAAEVFAPVRKQTVLFLLSLFISVVAIAVIGFKASQAFARPIIKLTDAAKDIAGGNFSRRVSVETQDETAQLADAFNQMAEKVEHILADLYEEKASVEKKVEEAVAEIEHQRKYLKERVDMLLEAMDAFSMGDLTVRLPQEEGELGRLFEGFNSSVENFRHVLLELNQAIDSVTSTALQIQKSSEGMAQGIRNQSLQVSEVSAATEEMTRTIMQNTENAHQTLEESKTNGEIASQGSHIVQQTAAKISQLVEVISQATQTIEKLNQSSAEIGEIISVIEEIADQTNLLALNAAIEAARAGEQGRGFAVVADEVRKLAERTTGATRKITDMIKTIQGEVQEAVGAMNHGREEVMQGLEYAEKAQDTLQQIVERTHIVAQLVEQIVNAGKEQTLASEQIANSAETISQVSESSADSIEEIAQSVQGLHAMMAELSELIRQFKTVNTHSSGDGMAADPPVTITPY